jgi:hypothetical protein
VLLWRALGDLEAIFREDRVGGEGGTTDLAAIGAVAEDLRRTSTIKTEHGVAVCTLASASPLAS